MSQTVSTTSESDLNAAIGTANGRAANAGTDTISLNQAISVASPLATFTPAAGDTIVLTGAQLADGGAGGTATINGPGRVVYANYNLYSGTTTVQQGTLALQSGGGLVNSALDLAASGAVFDISGTTGYAPVGGLSGVAGSTITLGTQTLTATGGGSFAGTISGAGGLTLSASSGTLILTGTNTYTGTTTINSGTLQIGTDGATGRIAGNVVDDGTLVLDNGATYAGVITGGGGVTILGGSSMFTADQAYSGATTIDGTLQLGNGGTTGRISGDATVNSGGTLIFDQSGTLSYSATISGAGSVQQAGTGTLTLSGSNTYTGGTTIGAGTLELAANNAAGTGPISFTAGQNGTLLADTAVPGVQVDNFTIGDTIDLRSIGLASSASVSGNTLSIVGPNGTSSIALGTSAAYETESFNVSSDGHGGTDITVGKAAATPAGTPYVDLQGSASQYTVSANPDGSLLVQDSVANRDGTQTISGSDAILFTNGTGLADPTGAVGAVARLYQAAFDRSPDLGGVQYWAGQMTGNDVPLSAVASAFASTPEFAADYGSDDNAAFVQQLYQNVLGRAGDSSGVDYWTNDLNNGISRGAVLQSFAESDENKTNTIGYEGNPDDAEAYRLYRAAFGYAPDQAGQDYWSGTLAGGQSNLAVAQGFVSSAEFQNEYANLSTTDFVNQLYQNVLGRAGDSAGVQYWTGQLAAGASQAQVVLGFADSTENRQITASATHDGWALIPS